MLEVLAVTRNRFGLVGQLAELVVAAAYGGRQENVSNRGYDVFASGRRLQVKGRMAGTGEAGKHVFMRGLDLADPPFDTLVYVQFGTDYELDLARAFPFEIVKALARYVPHTNSWRVVMTTSNLAKGTDVTEVVKAAYDGL